MAEKTPEEETANKLLAAFEDLINANPKVAPALGQMAGTMLMIARESASLRTENKALRDACEAMLTMIDTRQPRKLDDALTWRQNDELAGKMAREALLRSPELVEGKEGG